VLANASQDAKFVPQGESEGWDVQRELIRTQPWSGGPELARR
jgi:hypothetical protein